MIEIFIWFITFFITAATVTIIIYFFYQYRKRIRRMEKLKREIDEAKALNDKYSSFHPDKKTLESLDELLGSFKEFKVILEKQKREIEASKDLSDEKMKEKLEDLEKKLHEMEAQERELLHARDILLEDQ